MVVATASPLKPSTDERQPSGGGKKSAGRNRKRPCEVEALVEAPALRSSPRRPK